MIFDLFIIELELFLILIMLIRGYALKRKQMIKEGIIQKP